MFYRVLLLTLILPALTFSYSVVRKDGKIFSGELIQQTPTETILKDRQGITIRFKADQIDWNQTTLATQKDENAGSARVHFYQPVTTLPREISNRRKFTGEPFSFDFKDIDIKDLFRFIADISGLNVILDPGVKGTVTLKLTEVPWDQALDVITKNQGLGYTIEGNVIRIAPYATLSNEARAKAEAEKQQMLSAPLVTKIKRLSYAKATEMEAIVKKLLTPRGSTIVDPRTNTLIITDVATNMDVLTGTVGGFDY